MNFLRIIKFSGLWLMVVPLVVWAEDGSSGSGAHAAAANPEPGIFAGDIFTAIFTLTLFMCLLLILGKYAWKPILAGLQKREEHIRRTIEDAQQQQNDAQQLLEKYQAKLENIQQEAKKILEQGRGEARQMAAKMQEKAQEQIRQSQHQARNEIDRARQQAIKDIENQAAELATDLAGRIVGRTLDSQDHYDLLERSIQEMQQRN